MYSFALKEPALQNSIEGLVKTPNILGFKVHIGSKAF